MRKVGAREASGKYINIAGKLAQLPDVWVYLCLGKMCFEHGLSCIPRLAEKNGVYLVTERLVKPEFDPSDTCEESSKYHAASLLSSSGV